ncbi:hypothetical protein [Maridesulfovibrio sp.]|uniref:hypothetical protein n=1 Tax=Maridesulfovibrio sp. TaxID=2795000 RepID=UPI002AA67535|nr:hypothetical protein [Maridesulfovibrio sp.]
MSKVENQKYFVVEPDGFDGDNFENYHVVECIKKGEECETPKKKSLCGEKRDDCLSIFYYDDVVGENKLRTKLAKMQNDGKKICGKCVASLYADKK